MIQQLVDFCEKIAGMQPHTFACLVIPVVVQVIVLLIWAFKWKPPSEELIEEKR